MKNNVNRYVYHTLTLAGLFLLPMGMLCIFLFLFLSPDLLSASPQRTSDTVLIDAVLFDGVASDDEESVRLVNLSDDPVDLGGWMITDGGNRAAILPAGAVIEAGGYLWIARQGLAFQAQFGFQPDFEASDALAGTPAVNGSWPGYTNTGDEVFLINDADELIDVLIYEGGDPFSAGIELWSGPTVKRYSLPMSGKNGQILFRKRDVSTGLPIADTNTAADWAQDSEDPVLGRRVLYPGWALDQYINTVKIEETTNITIAVAPDNAYETISRLLKNATESIYIETHTFQNVAIMEALKAAAQRGVDVQILLDGSPSGGMKNEQRYNCDQLTKAGATCWFMIGNDALKISKRYAFMHAKFMVIDNQYAVIGSDNLSPNSWPADSKENGTWGRRGVSVVTDSSEVVSHLNNLFLADLGGERFPDIRAYIPEVDAPLAGYKPFQSIDYLTYTVQYNQPPAFQGRFEMELIQSPENSLNPNEGLFGLLARAGQGDVIYVQQQYERTAWGDDPLHDPNLRLAAYLEAARRGATLWLMLDHYFDDSRSDLSNAATCLYLRDLAIVEQLKIYCQRENPAGLGIHNKMVLANVDGKGYIHIGSINGSEGSSKANRELAIQVQSDDAYAYLVDIFQRDWVHTNYMPFVYNEYMGPANYVVISEILYDPIGLDDKEYIELANPFNRPIDLSHFSVSDALNPTEFADLRRFPANTVLSSNSSLVIAQQAQPFIEEYGVEPDFEILDTSPIVPNLIDDETWGDTATFIQWGNTGDVVILRDPNNLVVDVIAYGNREFPGQSTCPLVAASHSLRRNPFWRDTNSCLGDFEDWAAPVPGLLAR